MASAFHLKIDGENVSPETVALEDLLDTLNKFRVAIVAAAQDAGHHKNSIFLSLNEVRKSSNLLVIGESEAAADGSYRVSRAIRERDFSIIPAKSRKAIYGLWAKAKQRSWKVELSNGVIERAVIDPVRELPTDRTIRGATSVFVKVMRVGGQTPRILVKLPSGETRTFAIASQDLAQEIGKRLYQRVVLVGEAQWFLHSKKIAEFKVTKLGPYNETTADPAKAIREVSRIVGHRWEGIDPDAYIREERSDD